MGNKYSDFIEKFNAEQIKNIMILQVKILKKCIIL